MLIAKNGTQYNQLTNEIIKAHATYVNSPFVKVTSKKTGNEYNKYLDEEISIKLSKKYNITYVPKKSK